jgi:nucleoside 2-deoxyribosyltransferase
MQDVRSADGVFAIVNGTPPDEGVMVEVGAAYALNKPVFLFRDDFRRCTDSDHYPLNLMLFAGLPESNWQEMVYDSVDSIKNRERSLSQWAQS